MKGTLRQNIIGPSPFDAPWYETVLDGCALGMDITRMGQGDETLIGGDGIRLSGGQQSRLVRFPFLLVGDYLCLWPDMDIYLQLGIGASGLFAT